MIVSESDVLLAALDQRMTVDRTQALAPVGPVGSNARAFTAAAADPRTTRGAAAATRLPLGRTIAGQVLDVIDESHVLVNVDDVTLSLSWPQTGAPMPSTGQTVALRVLAHTPMLLFETVADVDPSGNGDAPLHLSPLARELQRSDASARGTIRFETPILHIALAPTDPSVREGEAISLDRVIVGRPAEPMAPVHAAPADTAGLIPLVLQGPAWPGQDVEVVVRRDPSDQALDNAVLDNWYGDLFIDLPNLGRVSGHLTWSVKGLRLRLEGQNSTTIAAMNEAGRDLVGQLLDASVPVAGFSVGGQIGRADS